MEEIVKALASRHSIPAETLEAWWEYLSLSCRGCNPVDAAEYARVSSGREAAIRTYERMANALDRAYEALPSFLKAVLKADYWTTPPPCTWEALQPYVRLAQAFQKCDYSSYASKVISAASLWWPQEFEQDSEEDCVQEEFEQA